MFELIIVLSVLGVLLVVLFGALAWTMYGAYRSLVHSRTGLVKADESLELARRSIDIQEKAMELAEQSLKKQDEIIRLLREMVEDRGRFTASPS